MKHKGIAEPVIEQFKYPAVKALNALNARNGRLLATMADTGELAQIGRSSELLSVVGKYGDRAMDFVWCHKGPLAVAVVLTAFLAEPEPFIDGVKDITKVAVDGIARPLAEVPGNVAAEAARNINWTMVALALVMMVGALAAIRVRLRNRLVVTPARRLDDI